MILASVYWNAFGVHFKRSSENIELLSQESDFHKKWGTFFYEFDYEENEYSHYFYVVFFVVRFFYALNLVVLSGFPSIQATVNVAIMFNSVVFLGLVKPHKEKILQVTTFLTELGLLFVFLEVTYFLGSGGQDTLVENIIIFTTIGCIAVQASGPLLISISSLISRCRGSNNETKVHPVEVNETSTFPHTLTAVRDQKQ